MSSNQNDRIDALERQVRELYVKFDILADRREKVNPRHDAKAISDKKIPKEHLGDMSKEALIHTIKEFETDYDAQTQKDLEDFRRRTKNKNHKRLRTYDRLKIQYELAKQRLKEIS